MLKRNSVSFFEFFTIFNKLVKQFKFIMPKKETLYMKLIDISDTLKVGPGKFGSRQEKIINKVIVHQSLSDADTIAINRYHISPNNHIKSGGCPKICYHYTIEKDGTIYKVNSESSIVWHCAGQNLNSIGICVLGDFDAIEYTGKNGSPTKKQFKSLELLLNNLVSKYNLEKINTHSNFGKPSCPGYDIEDYIEKYNNKIYWKGK